MWDAPARLIELLSLLQGDQVWSGRELAQKLGVTTRTVRRDVERLRELGYAVEADRGSAGYRLTGSVLPSVDGPSGLQAIAQLQGNAVDHPTMHAWPMRATVAVRAPADAVANRVWPGMGMVEATGAHECRMYVGADSVRVLVWMLITVDADFTVLNGPPELHHALLSAGQRCLSAVSQAP